MLVIRASSGGRAPELQKRFSSCRSGALSPDYLVEHPSADGLRLYVLRYLEMMIPMPPFFLNIKRRMVQMLSAILLHTSWGPEAKWFCNPVLDCHSCALSWFACPIGVFVHYSGYRIFPFLAAGTVLLVAVLLGRFFCGWICPFGFLQDILYRVPLPKISIPATFNWIKYAVLLVTVFAIPFALGEDTLFSFCRFCPEAAIQVTIPNIISSGLETITKWNVVTFAILAVVLMLAMLSSRSFCRILCPIGALLAPLNHVSFWKVRPPAGCVACGKCDSSCPTGVRPSERFKQGIPANRKLDCVVCHDCSAACPVQRSGKKAENVDRTGHK